MDLTPPRMYILRGLTGLDSLADGSFCQILGPDWFKAERNAANRDQCKKNIKLESSSFLCQRTDSSNCHLDLKYLSSGVEEEGFSYYRTPSLGIELEKDECLKLGSGFSYSGRLCSIWLKQIATDQKLFQKLSLETCIKFNQILINGSCEWDAKKIY